MEALQSQIIGSSAAGDPSSILITLILGLILLFIVYKVAKPFLRAAVIIVVGVLALMVLESLLMSLGYESIANSINLVTQVIYFVVELIIYALESILSFFNS